MPLAPGSPFGPYQIVATLGRGGMASVYKAYEAALDRHVALKILPAQYLHERDFAERFLREARTTAALEHVHIVPMYASGIEQGVPWMAMRLVTGGTLSTRLKAGRLDRALALDIISAMASALDYAHANGLVHRDVTSHNILLDDTGHAYLADFGIARMIEGFSTITSGIIGTPQYMAPEQAKGNRVDHRADIYALGIVAYEAFAGRVPFTSDTPAAILVKQILEPVPVPDRTEVPEPVMKPLLKCLAKEPDERWPSATEFFQALRAGVTQSLGGPPLLSGPPPLGAKTRLGRVPGSRWGRLWRWASLSLFVGSALGLLLWLGPRRGEAPSVAASRPGAPPPSPSAPTMPAERNPRSAAAPSKGILTPSLAPPRAPVEEGSPWSTATPEAPQGSHLHVDGSLGSILAIDGSGALRLPTSVDLAPGSHDLVVRKVGCNGVRQSVELLAGEERHVRLEPDCSSSRRAENLAAPREASRLPRPAPAPSPDSLSPGARRLGYLVGEWSIDGQFTRQAGAPASITSSCNWVGSANIICRTQWSDREPTWMVAGYDEAKRQYWSSIEGGRREPVKVEGNTWTFEHETKLRGAKVRERTTLTETSPTTAGLRAEISWDGKTWQPHFEGVERRRSRE